ncbi:hypothetical protein [Bacillus sp. JJ722]|uniref:hypothetical protein n=1 Tax=Bacillus sp. JJ722 TaxID=3122973 RepID=UPI003000ADD1
MRRKEADCIELKLYNHVRWIIYVTIGDVSFFNFNGAWSSFLMFKWKIWCNIGATAFLKDKKV